MKGQLALECMLASLLAISAIAALSVSVMGAESSASLLAATYSHVNPAEASARAEEIILRSGASMPLSPVHRTEASRFRAAQEAKTIEIGGIYEDDSDEPA